MNSKEALRTIFINCKEEMIDKNGCVVNSENLVKTILQDLDRLEKLEKDLKQTKLNFKNSQTHSRTHYKKLLDRYMSLEKENQELLVYKNVAQGIATKLKIENDKLKKVIEILKRFNFNLNETRHNSTGWEIWTDSLLESEELTQKEYDLLKEVLENERNGESKKED